MSHPLYKIVYFMKGYPAVHKIETEIEFFST